MSSLYLAGTEPIAYSTTLLGCLTLGMMELGMAYMLMGMQLTR